MRLSDTMRSLSVLLISFLVGSLSFVVAQESESNHESPEEMSSNAHPMVVTRDTEDEIGMRVDRFTSQAIRAVNEGNESWTEGDYERSLASYKLAVSLQPDLFPAQYNLGIAQLCVKNYPEAEAAFSEAVKLREQSAEAWEGLGIAQFRQKQFGEAIESLQTANTISSSDANLNNNLGFAYLQTKRFAEAVTSFKRALELDSVFVSSKLGLCIGSVLGGQFKAGIDSCLEVASVDKDSPVPPYMLGLAYVGVKKPEKALSFLTQAASLEPRSAQIYKSLGFANYQLQNYKTALQFFSRGLQLNPKMTEARTAIGSTYFQLKQYDKSKQVLMRAVSEDPNDFTARLNLGLVCLVRDERDCALRQYNYLKVRDVERAQELFKFIVRGRVIDARQKRR